MEGTRFYKILSKNIYLYPFIWFEVMETYWLCRVLHFYASTENTLIMAHPVVYHWVMKNKLYGYKYEHWPHKTSYVWTVCGFWQCDFSIYTHDSRVVLVQNSYIIFQFFFFFIFWLHYFLFVQKHVLFVRNHGTYSLFVLFFTFSWPFDISIPYTVNI